MELKKQNAKLRDQRTDCWLPNRGFRGVGKMGEVIQKYELPVIK